MIKTKRTRFKYLVKKFGLPYVLKKLDKLLLYKNSEYTQDYLIRLKKRLIKTYGNRK